MATFLETITNLQSAIARPDKLRLLFRRLNIIAGGVVSPPITGDYMATIDDSTINCTSGTFTVTILSATGNEGKRYDIKNSGNGVITVEDTGDNIDNGVAILTQYDSITVQSTGAEWIIL